MFEMSFLIKVLIVVKATNLNSISKIQFFLSIIQKSREQMVITEYLSNLLFTLNFIEALTLLNLQ